MNCKGEVNLDDWSFVYCYNKVRNRLYKKKTVCIKKKESFDDFNLRDKGDKWRLWGKEGGIHIVLKFRKSSPLGYIGEWGYQWLIIETSWWMNQNYKQILLI